MSQFFFSVTTSADYELMSSTEIETVFATQTHTMCSLLSVFTIGHRLTIDFTIGRTLHTHSHSPSSNSSSTLAKLLLG